MNVGNIIYKSLGGDMDSQYLDARQTHEYLVETLGRFGSCVLMAKLLVRKAGTEPNPMRIGFIDRFIFPPQEVILTDDNSGPGSDHDPNFIVDGEFLRYSYDKDAVVSMLEIHYDEKPDAIIFGAVFVQGEDKLSDFVNETLNLAGLVR